MSTETRRPARRPAGPASGALSGSFESPALGAVPLTGWSLWEEWESDPPAGGGGGGAPDNASYVVLGVNGTLTQERVLTQGVGIVLTDAGAGSTLTVAAGTLDTIPDPVASVDFAQQQALRFRLENRTSDPGAPAEGEIWLRTDL